MCAMLPLESAGTWQSTSQTTAPAKMATGNTRRPWNSRMPFQIMPQATKISAAGTSRGMTNSPEGALQNTIDEAPTR